MIGGILHTPKMLRMKIHELVALLDDKRAPFGVDLLLPKVGGSARKTNIDCRCEDGRAQRLAIPRRDYVALVYVPDPSGALALRYSLR